MERVQYSLERSLPQLQLLDREGLLSKEELRSITSQRSGFEARLVRRKAEKQDYLLYLDFEDSFNKLVVLRARQREREAHIYAKEHGDRSKLLPRHFFSRQGASYSATCISIYERLVRKFRWDVDSWERYLRWAQSNKMRVVTSRVFARAIALHPRVVSLWLQAADYELNNNADTTTARSLLQRALRINTLDNTAVDERESKLQKTSRGAMRTAGAVSWKPLDYERDVLRLWIEYFRMELVFIERLRRRWKILGLEAEPQGLVSTGVSGGFAAAKKTARSVADSAAPIDQDTEYIERAVQDDVPEQDKEEEEEEDKNESAPVAGNDIPDGHRKIMQGAIPLVLLQSAQENVPAPLQAILYIALLQLLNAFPFFDSTVLLPQGDVICLNTSNKHNGDRLRAQLTSAVLNALCNAAGGWNDEGQMISDMITSIYPLLSPRADQAMDSNVDDELEKNALLHRASRINVLFSEPIDSLYGLAEVPQELSQLVSNDNSWATSHGILFIVGLMSKHFVQMHAESASKTEDKVLLVQTPLVSLYTRSGELPTLMEKLVISLRANLAARPNDYLAVATLALLFALSNNARFGIDEPNLRRYLGSVVGRLQKDFQDGRLWLVLVGIVSQWSAVLEGADTKELVGQVTALNKSGAPGAHVLTERIARHQRNTGIDDGFAAAWPEAKRAATAWKSALSQSNSVDALCSDNVASAGWSMLILWCKSVDLAVLGTAIVQPSEARIALWNDYFNWISSVVSGAQDREAAARWAWDQCQGAVKQTGALLASSRIVGELRIEAQRLHDSVVRDTYLIAPLTAPLHGDSVDDAQNAALRMLLARSSASTICWLELARAESDGDASRAQNLFEHAVTQSERDYDVVDAWLMYLEYLVPQNINEAMKQLTRAGEYVRRVGGASAVDALENGWKQLVS